MITINDLQARFLAVAAVGLAMTALLVPAESKADAYIGGSVGQAGIEVDVGDQLNPIIFDEDDFAWKVFAGYEFPFPVLNLGIEVGYVDLGGPSANLGGTQFEIDSDGFNAFGLLGFDLGPLGVFAKAGVISWDSELSIDGVSAVSEDGSDPAYGVGARFGVGPVDIRAEYEFFDIEDAEDIAMVSVGLTWSF